MKRSILLQGTCLLGLAATSHGQLTFNFTNAVGSAGNDWEEPGNWDLNQLPTQDSRIFINAGNNGSDYAEIQSVVDVSNNGNTGGQANQRGIWVGDNGGGGRLEVRGIGNSLTVNDAYLRIGNGSGSTGLVNVFTGAQLTTNHDIRVGEGGGEGRLVVVNATVDAGRIVHFNGSYVFQGTANVTATSNADGNSGSNLQNIQLLGFNGNVNLRASSNDTDGFQSFHNGNSTINSGGEFTTNREVRVGWGHATTLNVNGGTLNVGSYLPVGRNSGGNGTINLIDGVINANVSAADTYLTAFGTFDDAVGVMNQTGGTFNQNGIRGIALGELDNGTGTYNLDGGDLFTQRIFSANGNGTLNFDGGTLHAAATRTDFIDNLTVNVEDGGAFVNTEGFDVTSLSAFIGAGAGGLTKQGAGALTLQNSGNSVDATLVSAGTLFVTGQLGSTGAGTTVANGAAIGGTGTLVGDLMVEIGGNIDITPGILDVDPASNVSFGGFDFDDIIGFDTQYGSTVPNAPNGVYPILNGAFTLDPAGLAYTQASPLDIGGGRIAYFAEGSLNVVVIPESSTALLGGLGLLGIAGRRRRSRGEGDE